MGTIMVNWTWAVVNGARFRTGYSSWNCCCHWMVLRLGLVVYGKGTAKNYFRI